MNACLVSFILACQIFHAESRLIAAAIMPHGDFAYDPSLLAAGTPEREAANEVAQAARKAGKVIASVDPDIILLSTPHGIELSTDFAIYLGSHASGYANIGSDLPNSTAHKVEQPQIDLAPEISKNLMTKLSNEGVSGILPFADSEDMALRWGEVIPLLLIPNTDKSRLRNQQRRRHIIWSHPLRRYTDSPAMVPELVRIGMLLFEWAELTELDIAIVISSDLSHTHQADGPYGYSNASQPFDDAVGAWAKNPCQHSSQLLTKARSLQEDAKSCGFTGLVLLHGALCHDQRITEFKATMLANRNATYYGMMAATFERQCHDGMNVDVS